MCQTNSSSSSFFRCSNGKNRLLRTSRESGRREIFLKLDTPGHCLPGSVPPPLLALLLLLQTGFSNELCASATLMPPPPPPFNKRGCVCRHRIIVYVTSSSSSSALDRGGIAEKPIKATEGEKGERNTVVGRCTVVVINCVEAREQMTSFTYLLGRRSLTSPE